MALQLRIEDNSYLQGIYLKGEKKGEKKGERRILQRQLEHRFGKLPKWAERQLAGADTATLEEWGLRLFDARRLEEVVPRNGQRRPREQR